MKKILHIITRMDMGGSAQNTMENCLGTLDTYKVVLVCGLARESNMTKEQTAIVEGQLAAGAKKGMKVIQLPSLLRKICPWHDTLALFSLWRILRAEKPDIVHTHTSKAGIIGRLAALLARVPIIIHTTHGHVFYGHFSPGTSRLFLFLEKCFATISDKMVALTEGEKQDYIKFRLCPEEKIIKIHSGVKVDKFLHADIDIKKQKQALGISDSRFIVGTVGWLWPIKGPMYLLKAMAIVWHSKPECELVFVGKGELEEDLKKAASEMGVSAKVKFLGWHREIENIMPVFDLFALASLNEGMGRVLVEAMAAGKPIVASNVGGVPDLVTPGKTGHLVPPADEKALAKAILSIVNKPQQARQMGAAGRHACQDYSVAAMLKKLNDMYEDTLQKSA